MEENKKVTPKKDVKEFKNAVSTKPYNETKRGIEEAKKVKKVEEVKKVEKVEEVKRKIVLKNTKGEDVDEKDYFFGGKSLPTFNKICGLPVIREDLLSVFNKTFNPDFNFLFYKTTNKEVYVIIIPIKYSSTIGKFNDSIEGDFQKHAISFVGEGSVNIDTLKQKLKRINTFVKYDDR